MDRRLINGLATLSAFAAAFAMRTPPARSGSAQVVDIPQRPGTSEDGASVFFVGTATTVLRLGGFTLLTDPNFIHAGDHLHVGYGQIARRLTDPAIEIHELPALDAVLLSHMHADHFDHVAAAELDRSLPIVTTHHAARRLGKLGFREPWALKTWESITLTRGDERLRITSMPGRHAPGLIDYAMPPVMGSLLDLEDAAGRRKLRLYITGDTLMYDQIHKIPQHFPDIDVALIHLGGTIVFGFLMVTMDDKQGVELLQTVRPRIAIPIHYGDYDLFKSPLSDFQHAVRMAGLENQVVCVERGQRFEIPIASLRQLALR